MSQECSSAIQQCAEAFCASAGVDYNNPGLISEVCEATEALHVCVTEANNLICQHPELAAGLAELREGLNENC